MENAHPRAPMGPLSIAGLNVIVTDTWLSGFAWREFGPVNSRRAPSKASGRVGTRRQWKRLRARDCGLRWRHGPIEPDHMMQTAEMLICTQKQFETLQTKLRLAA